MSRCELLVTKRARSVWGRGEQCSRARRSARAEGLERLNTEGLVSPSLRLNSLGWKTSGFCLHRFLLALVLPPSPCSGFACSVVSLDEVIHFLPSHILHLSVVFGK